MKDLKTYDEEMNDNAITPHDDNAPVFITKSDEQEVMAITNAAQSMVETMSNAVCNVATTVRDIKVISAQVEVETKRIDHALDCLMAKAQHNIQIYQATLPLLEKNFASMQARMDRLMDRSLDMLTSDTSDTALAKQEIVMKMIEDANNSLNAMIAKLLPNI